MGALALIFKECIWQTHYRRGCGHLVKVPGASRDLAQIGYSLFEDTESLSASDDAVAYAERLFGKRPIRYQRMLVEHSPLGNQQSMPKTMFAGALHNDCAQMGMPPQYQVMICEKQSAGGGDSLLLDLWPILESIQIEDPQLFHDLFFVPRAYPSGHATRFGLTWSLMRGNLVCQHTRPGFATAGSVKLFSATSTQSSRFGSSASLGRSM